MTRFEDWETRLAEALADMSAPQWGKNDCAMRAFGAIAAITGVDIGEPWRGQYSTEFGALRQIVEFGCTDMEGVAEKLAGQHGLEEVPVLTAQRGDLVLVDSDQGPALGIVGLDGWWVIVAGADAVVRVPLRACRRAWRI